MHTIHHWGHYDKIVVGHFRFLDSVTAYEWV